MANPLTPPEARPWLALDVDGPIVLMGEHCASEVFHAVVNEIPLTIARALPARLARLTAHFRIVWSTSWERSASTKIGPLVGLPADLPYLRFDRFRRRGAGVSYKLPTLQRSLGNLPAAVVDDEIGLDMWEWSRTRPNTLIVEIDPRHGILDAHVEQLIEFAAAVRGSHAR